MSVMEAARSIRAAALVIGGTPSACDHVAALLDLVALAPTDGTLALVLAQDADDPVAAVRAAVGAHPAARVVVVVRAATAPAVLRRTLVAGAAGVVFDDELDGALAASCAAVAAGQLAVPAAMGRQVAPRPLSHRERQVLSLVVEGRTNREIADRLFLAESTVKTHVASIFAKLDTHSRAEVVARVLEDGGGIGLGLGVGIDPVPAP